MKPRPYGKVLGFRVLICRAGDVRSGRRGRRPLQGGCKCGAWRVCLTRCEFTVSLLRSFRRSPVGVGVLDDPLFKQKRPIGAFSQLLRRGADTSAVGHGRHRRAGKAGGATAQKRFYLGKTKEMGWISSLRQRLQQANRRVPPHRFSRPVRPFSPSAPSGRSRVSSRRRGNRTGK